MILGFQCLVLAFSFFFYNKKEENLSPVHKVINYKTHSYQ
jgi:hypothetical protein